MALQKKNVKCAREVAILAPYAAKCCVRDDISNMPSFTACIEYAIERVESFEEEYGKINFYALMGMPLAVFDVPASFDGTTRYEASLFGSEAFFLKLEAFRAALAKLDFPGVRMVYNNFALRAVLRALYAIEHRERDCFNGVFNRLS